MINNRQNGRRRGRGGGGQRPGGGGGQGQRDSGNRIDSRARGNAAQLHEKYRNMARDAQMSGDRVNTEYYLQFADHYFRVLADQRGRSDDQQPRRIRDDFDPFDQFDGSDDFGDEGDAIRADDLPRGVEGDGRGARDDNRQQRDRDEGRQSRDRDDHRQSRDREDGRPSRDRDESRPPRERAEARPPRDRDDRRPRDGTAEPRFQRAAQPVAQSFADQPANDQAGASSDTASEEAPRPRRTRKPRVEEAADAGIDVALGADRLPPALGAPAGDDGEEAAPKPRRRRVRTAAAEAPQAG